jgi:hypothetical protein
VLDEQGSILGWGKEGLIFISFYPQGKTSDSSWIGSWVSPKACLDAVAKTKFQPQPGIERRSSSPYPELPRLALKL